MKKFALVVFSLVMLMVGLFWIFYSEREMSSESVRMVDDAVRAENVGARSNGFVPPGSPLRKIPASDSPRMVVKKSDESRLLSNILPDDEREEMKEQLAELESVVDEHIKAYDENLSDLDKRKEIERRFGERASEIKQLAMKLAKDELARNKLESMN